MADPMKTIELLRTDKSHFSKVYIEHKDRCLRFMFKMINDGDLIQDIYHDALIVLYENAHKKDFKLTCSIQTYLNSICRNQVLTKYREKSKSVVLSDDFNSEIIDWFDEVSYEDELRLSSYQQALTELKQKSSICYELLKSFFFKKMSMAEIAEEFSYTNANNAKNQKAKCQKKLKLRCKEIYSSTK